MDEPLQWSVCIAVVQLYFHTSSACFTSSCPRDVEYDNKQPNKLRSQKNVHNEEADVKLPQSVGGPSMCDVYFHS